jgi:hypothetical protein
MPNTTTTPICFEGLEASQAYPLSPYTSSGLVRSFLASQEEGGIRRRTSQA